MFVVSLTFLFLSPHCFAWSLSAVSPHIVFFAVWATLLFMELSSVVCKVHIGCEFFVAPFASLFFYFFYFVIRYATFRYGG